MKKEYQTIKGTIKRETSKYNKYMKWHVEFFRKDGSLLSSQYERTRKDAEGLFTTHEMGYGGDKLLITTYKLI